MPLPRNRKLFGIQQIYQPPLSQQLGVIGPQVDTALLWQFWKAIPTSFRLIQFSVALPPMPLATKQEWPGRQRTNLILPLDRPYTELQANYNKSLRKRLKKAGNHYQIQEAQDLGFLIRYYQEHIGQKAGLSTKDYQILERLFDQMMKRKMACIYQVQNAEAEVDATGIFLITNQRIINVFGASNAAGRQHYAMHFLLDQVIQIHAAQDLLFDFEGSELPGVATFFQSFGAQAEPYFEFYQDRLPWMVKQMKAFKRLIKS